MKKLFIFFLLINLLSCTSVPNLPPDTDTPAIVPGEFVFTTQVYNATLFDIEILDDSRVIPALSKQDITLPKQLNELTEGYSVTYRVKLSEDVIRSVPGENIVIKPDQKEVIVASPAFQETESFIVIRNNSRQVIRLKRTAGSTYRNNLASDGVSPGREPELAPGNTKVYLGVTGKNPFSIETDQEKIFDIPVDEYSSGTIYSVEFDGASAVLTDARPLRRVNEKGWVKPLDRAGEMPRLAADGAGNINVFNSAEEGIEYFSFAAADGTEMGKAEAAGEDAFVYAAIPGQDGDFIAAGSSKPRNLNDRVPFLWKKTNEGMEKIPFPASYRNAELFTLAQGDSAILAAGSALKEGKSGDYTAYLRALRDEGTRMAPLWELGPRDLDEKYGEVRSAMYDSKNGIWRVTGKTLEYDNLGNLITGAYLMEIDGGGAVLKPPASFKGFSFYKITGGNDGAYYLIGEEEKGDESGAVVIKYDESGKLLWRQKTPLPVFSYYNDAVLVEDGSRIVLAGTMRANDAAGAGGVPFIQCIETAAGGETWRSELTGPDFQGTSLVSAIVKAPEYGYAAALCGIADGESGKPYLIIRVNEQGLLLK
jgi:hypothetical protein